MACIHMHGDVCIHTGTHACFVPFFHTARWTDDRQTETDRDRQRQTETDRDRQRQTERQRDRQTDRDGERRRETESDRERQRETERQTASQPDSQTDRQTDRDRQRQTETDRDRHRQTQTDTDTLMACLRFSFGQIWRFLIMIVAFVVSSFFSYASLCCIPAPRRSVQLIRLRSFNPETEAA